MNLTELEEDLTYNIDYAIDLALDLRKSEKEGDFQNCDVIRPLANLCFSKVTDVEIRFIGNLALQVLGKQYLQVFGEKGFEW